MVVIVVVYGALRGKHVRCFVDVSKFNTKAHLHVSTLYGSPFMLFGA